MAHSCSRCNFTANFESALKMHRQLHHETDDVPTQDKPKATDCYMKVKSCTMPRSKLGSFDNSFSDQDKSLKLSQRNSATKLFDKLRSRICRSRTLFVHPEEAGDPKAIVFTADSDCTSKALNVNQRMDGMFPSGLALNMREPNEKYSCHLCSFDADRITVLDRHLLNDHKITIENLLKLVMAKTKDGLCDDQLNTECFGIRQPYYKPVNELIDQGEFLIETVVPKITIVKHAATNTDLKWTDISHIKEKSSVTDDMEEFLNVTIGKTDKEELLDKMQSLNECMCKFVDSTRTLKKVLTDELYAKSSARKSFNDTSFDLGLGDQEPVRDWELRGHSDKQERNRERPRSTRSDSAEENYYF